MSQNEINEYMVVFASQSQAVFLYNELINKGYNVKFASAPCTLSNGCSKCIKFEEKYLGLIIDEIKKNRIRTKGIYKIVRDYSGNLKYVLVKKDLE